MQIMLTKFLQDSQHGVCTKAEMILLVLVRICKSKRQKTKNVNYQF